MQLPRWRRWSIRRIPFLRRIEKAHSLSKSSLSLISANSCGRVPVHASTSSQVLRMARANLLLRTFSWISQALVSMLLKCMRNATCLSRTNTDEQSIGRIISVDTRITGTA
jgi:hypothetical protein